MKKSVFILIIFGVLILYSSVCNAAEAYVYSSHFTVNPKTFYLTIDPQGNVTGDTAVSVKLSIDMAPHGPKIQHIQVACFAGSTPTCRAERDINPPGYKFFEAFQMQIIPNKVSECYLGRPAWAWRIAANLTMTDGSRQQLLTDLVAEVVCQCSSPSFISSLPIFNWHQQYDSVNLIESTGSFAGKPYKINIMIDSNTVLPPGMRWLDNSRGILTGWTTHGGTWQLMLWMHDECTKRKIWANLPFIVECPYLYITTQSELPTGKVGQAYNEQLSSSLSRIDSYNVIESSLPPSLTLSSTGLISGTPKKEGCYYFAVKVKDGCPLDPAAGFTKRFVLKIEPPLTLQRLETETIKPLQVGPLQKEPLLRCPLPIQPQN